MIQHNQVEFRVPYLAERLGAAGGYFNRIAAACQAAGKRGFGRAPSIRCFTAIVDDQQFAGISGQTNSPLGLSETDRLN